MLGRRNGLDLKNAGCSFQLRTIAVNGSAFCLHRGRGPSVIHPSLNDLGRHDSEPFSISFLRRPSDSATAIPQPGMVSGDDLGRRYFGFRFRLCWSVNRICGKHVSRSRSLSKAIVAAFDSRMIRVTRNEQESAIVAVFSEGSISRNLSPVVDPVGELEFDAGAGGDECVEVYD
jgi:hypothetical protein